MCITFHTYTHMWKIAVDICILLGNFWKEIYVIVTFEKCEVGEDVRLFWVQFECVNVFIWCFSNDDDDKITSEKSII